MLVWRFQLQLDVVQVQTLGVEELLLELCQYLLLQSELVQV